MEKELEPNIENYLKNLKTQIRDITSTEYEDFIEKLLIIIENINEKESKLNLLIEKRNELQELKNQLRHVEKKSKAYDIKKYNNIVKERDQKLKSEKLKNKIEKLSKVLIDLDKNEKVSLWNFIISIIILRKKPEELKENGILMHLILEEYYLKSLIEENEKIFINANFEELKNEIKDLYMQKYIPISKIILNKVIKANFNENLLRKVIEDVEFAKNQKPSQENKTPILKVIKNELLSLSPIVLTTVDSVISNYKKYFENGNKVDYIIIDEASQCDILSALPLLYLAKNIIIVGDQKQLSAITSLDTNKMKNTVPDEYNYIKENFLSSIDKTIRPCSKLLLEHYRCDYNIINYCNKFFYNNKLKIYKDAKKGAMSLVNEDKGKYVEKLENGSYYNNREIKAIDEMINENIDGKFIITPFKPQAEILQEKYGKLNCGTIHTFQGKGEKEVYFSSVLNKTKQCVNHLNGEYNLFTKELINVAVSRAKDRFVLVSDAKFFKENDKNMKNLIEYIEIYGENIPDKTVCIFDNLYKEIPTYKKTIKNIDNIFEEKVYHLLENYIEKNKEYNFVCKLPLAEFVTDKKFLNENKELKDFILNNSHLDFALYTNSINKPVLAIEVDGKKHKEKYQKDRDAKKEKILEYMEIPLLRIPSKVVWEEKEFEEQIDKKLENN